MSTKILLADDSVTIQKVVELTFSDKNYEVTTVSDGESAIRKAREKRPDIILLDVIMPGMDGYEVCSVLKQDPELKEVPVLLLTGTFEVFDTERSQRVGANGYITKPFESQELIARVRKLVNNLQSESVTADEDLDADLMLPELEKDEPVEPKKGPRQAMEEEDFPEFTFDTDTESTDSEILFDFSMDTVSAPAAQEAARPIPARGQANARAASPEPVKEAPVIAKTPVSSDYDDDEPTFELPEFDLPDESETAAAAKPSMWDIDDQELTNNLAAITTPSGKVAPAKVSPARAAEDNRFVLEEAREIAKATGMPMPQFPTVPAPASVDLKPLLDRLEKIEAALDRPPAPAAAPEAAQLLERMARFESLLSQRPAPVAAAPDTQLLERMARFESLLSQQKPAPPAPIPTEAIEQALAKRFPQILDRLSETVAAKLPEIVDKAAEKLTSTVASQFTQRLAGDGIDSREIITAIAWQVVPDVAEMLVRREIEEIRRNI